jgi:Cdc6-like AAA superfamily ATPase|tara:strand:+ start:1408 stop:3081 length:1674 start_codon:yes stop_codon:yes gene_type:complete
MAQSFPNTPDFVTTSEKLVFDNLLSLSDSWHIYSNMQQHVTFYERISRGEVDFLLTHPYFGIVLIEVKGYGVYCEDGTWFRAENSESGRKYNKKTKDPYTQIEQARGNLIEFLFQNIESFKPVIKSDRELKKITSSIHTIVAFPYMPDFNNLGMKASKSNTITQSELSNLTGYFKDNIPQKDFGEIKGMQEKLKEVILPDINASPLRGLTKNLEAQQLSATNEQKIILNAIADNNNYVSVTGPAGSGKTVLAVETARNMAEKKKKILFLCYNQNLSRYLSNLFSEEPLIEVHSLFGLFTSIDINLKDLGTANLSPKQAAPLIANTLNENFDKFNTEFDVLIIDEAQDFSPLFWPIFELMTENKKWFLFSDKRQAITHDDWQLPDLENNSWLTYPLTKYLRSTREISDKVLKVYKDSYEALAINGLEPEYLETKDSGWTESLEVLTKVLTGLIEVEKYHPWQIQILIPHSRYLEDVEQAKYKANQKIGGIKDLNIESIYKYKGLESEVVILLIPNLESLESENTSDIKSLIYVGMSRATSFLIVIGDKEIKKLSNWDS